MTTSLPPSSARPSGSSGSSRQSARASRSGRGSTLRTLLIAALVIGVPILEVWLLIQLGHAIGVWLTLALLIAEAVVGTWLLKREGSRAWHALTDAVRRGSLPVSEATDAALVLVGGVLLILPGLVTDLFGLIFLLPATRPLARRLVQLFIARKVDAAGLSGVIGATRGRMNLDGQTIDGEVVDVTPPTGGASSRRPDADHHAANVREIGATVVEGEIID